MKEADMNTENQDPQAAPRSMTSGNPYPSTLIRRLAGVAGIFPVDMPARLQLEVETAVIAAARIKLCFAKYKLYMQMRDIGGIRRSQHRQPSGNQKEQHENEAENAHHGKQPGCTSLTQCTGVCWQRLGIRSPASDWA